MKKWPKQNKVILDFSKNPNSHKLPVRVFNHVIDHMLEIPANHKVSYRIDTKAKTLTLTDLTAKKQITFGVKRNTSIVKCPSGTTRASPRSRSMGISRRL